MAKIRIPPPVLPGIKYISTLNKNNIRKLVDYLTALPIDIEFSNVSDELNTLLDFEHGNNLLQTIISFNKLVKGNSEENKIVVQNLIESYIELSDDNLNNKEQNNLRTNLSLIFSNFAPIKEIIAARELYSSHENILSESKLLTDVRLVFKEQIDDKNRAAIITHKLHLEYNKNDEFNEIYFALDLKDLNKLKVQIEKAIEKDQILREDYKNILNFIF